MNDNAQQKGCRYRVALWRWVRPIRLWLNAATADEGCTMVDARKLREYNHGLADENEQLRRVVETLMNAYEKMRGGPTGYTTAIRKIYFEPNKPDQQ